MTLYTIGDIFIIFGVFRLMMTVINKLLNIKDVKSSQWIQDGIHLEIYKRFLHEAGLSATQLSVYIPADADKMKASIRGLSILSQALTQSGLTIDEVQMNILWREQDVDHLKVSRVANFIKFASLGKTKMVVSTLSTNTTLVNQLRKAGIITRRIERDE